MKKIYINPFLETKKRNMNLLHKLIKESGTIKYTKLIATYEYNTGVSKWTARGHLQTLVEMGVAIIENGFVKVKD